MSAYPISYRPEYVEKRSRLTTFFRLFMMIPVFIVVMLYGLCAIFTGIAAWFAILFTGRYPAGLYRFNSGVLRMSTRANAYFFLQTDAYPPFDTGEHPEYPVRLEIAPPQETYSRVKTFFRLILGIPVVVVSYVFGQAAEAVAFVTWFVVVFMGRCPRGLFNATRFLNGFTTRVYAYMFLLTDQYPSFSDDGAEPGYLPPGYDASAYGQPLAAPGYEQPGYQPPGYQPPADPYAPPVYGTPPQDPPPPPPA